MIVVIAGSRSITSYEDVVSAIRESGWEITEILCGDAKGVDLLGEKYGLEHGIPVRHFPARWDDLAAPNAVIRTSRGRQYNVRAGFDRNEDMAVAAEGGIIVWDGVSTGSQDMRKRLERHGKPVFVKTFSKTVEKDIFD